MDCSNLNLEGCGVVTNKVIKEIRDLNSTSNKDSIDRYVNAVEELRVFLKTKLKNEDIERAIEKIFIDHDDALDETPSDAKNHATQGQLLLSAIHTILDKRASGILILESYLHMCLSELRDLKEPRNFKILFQFILSCAQIVKKFWNSMLNRSQKLAYVLYLNQIGKCFPFLLKCMETGNVVIERYLVDRLIQCLMQMVQELHNPSMSDKDMNGCEFINLMDSALKMLFDLSKDSLSELNTVVDELLCHAMSVAQVTSSTIDYKAICGHSQRVLTEIGTLHKAVNDNNSARMDLQANVITDGLCVLEQTVNHAVLRLVLEVFTELNGPLKRLIAMCQTPLPDKHARDLDNVITSFDLDMDRIMQIGLFSVSCTSDVQSVVAIKSCLASLESLQVELIASVTAAYLEDSSTNKSNLSLLLDHWLKEMDSLKSLINCIIDPAAFAQVVHNQVELCAQQAKASTSPDTLESEVKQMIKYGRKLVRMVKQSKEIERGEGKEILQQCVLSLQAGLQECEGALKLITMAEDLSEMQLRVLKRCDLVVARTHAVMSQLQQMVGNYTNITLSDNTQELSLASPAAAKCYYKLCPETCGTTNLEQLDMILLTPFLQQGQQINRERTIMYATPKNAKVGSCRISNKKLLDMTGPTLQTPPLSCRSRYHQSAPRKLQFADTIDHEITAILENLSQLSTTFTGKLDITSNMDSLAEHLAFHYHDDEEEEPHLPGSLCSLSSPSSLAASKDSNNQFHSLERLQDLLAVEKKIELLKTHMSSQNLN